MIHPILAALAGGHLSADAVATRLVGPSADAGPSVSTELFRLKRAGEVWLVMPPTGCTVRCWAVVDAQTPGWARP